jgi:hypothetical protein
MGETVGGSMWVEKVSKENKKKLGARRSKKKFPKKIEIRDEKGQRK